MTMEGLLMSEETKAPAKLLVPEEYVRKTQKPVPAGFYSEEELAMRARVSVKRLRNIFAAEEYHPPYLGRGADKIFPVKEADAWLERQLKKVKRRR